MPFYFKIIIAYWIIGLIAAMIVPIFGFEKLSATFRLILALVFGTSTIIMWFGGAVIKRYIEIGHFELTNDELNVFENDNCEIFKLSELEIIRFTVSCEQGEPIGRVAISEGIDNDLYFKKDDKIFKYNFLVEDLSQVNYLRRKIAYLKEKGFKITISP